MLSVEIFSAVYFLAFCNLVFFFVLQNAADYTFAAAELTDDNACVIFCSVCIVPYQRKMSVTSCCQGWVGKKEIHWEKPTPEFSNL